MNYIHIYDAYALYRSIYTPIEPAPIAGKYHILDQKQVSNSSYNGYIIYIYINYILLAAAVPMT